MFPLFRLIKLNRLPPSVCGYRPSIHLSSGMKRERRRDGGEHREGDGRMSRLKAKEEAVKFERGEDVLFREETEMGREVGGVGVKIEPGSTSEIPAVKEKKKSLGFKGRWDEP